WSGYASVLQEAQGEQAEQSAEHEDLGVCEVDQLQDTVDERVAQRDERDDRPGRDAIGQPEREVRRDAMHGAGPPPKTGKGAEAPFPTLPSADLLARRLVRRSEKLQRPILHGVDVDRL